jgi:tRNA(fMet)-specific endonuclease VapC
VSYLLDTNVCIALINGRPAAVRARFAAATANGDPIAVPSISIFELWYGIEKSQRRAANVERLSAFLSGPLEVLSFDTDDARAAGVIRATLEATGRRIGAYDILIAAQALRRKLTLVTANVSEFSRVKGLVWEDWGGR